MPRVIPGRRVRPVTALAAAALLAACAGAPPATVTSPTPSASPTEATTATAPTTQVVAEAKSWFDLDAGDCLADPPPGDPNVLAVALVDCAQPHQAEVYLRKPLAVNTALADVADRDCGEGFVDYTGRQVGGPLAVTYLIDSNQNRTSDNPNPSTVICLVVDANGQPLTGSARR